MITIALALAALLPIGTPVTPSWTPRQEASVRTPPTELFEVVKVVDGDTLHVARGSSVEKLRLLSVDTEEKITGNTYSTPSKPATIYGEETTLWAKEFFAGLAEEGEPTRVGLRFPEGEERRDVYGRLLCHVILPDGEDYNVMLVRTGRSPYFNKYGNSRVAHAAFVAAQEAARREKLGVWNPATNRPTTPDAPAARRDYARLLPWWQARADAIAAFRENAAKDPTRYVDAEDPEGLARAAELGEPVSAFGSVFKRFAEDDGSVTYLMRGGDKERALRVHVPADRVAAVESGFDFEGLVAELRQNYAWIRGEIRRTRRGFELVCTDPSAWSLAGPEPALPAMAREAATGTR